MSYLNCSGALILSKASKRCLFLQRTHVKSYGQWGLAGGKSEPNDLSSLDTLLREMKEELGMIPEYHKIIPLDHYISEDQNFHYGTFVIIVDQEFQPHLNSEHSGYCWTDYRCPPKPLHRGLSNTLNNKVTKIKLDTILSVI